MSVGSAGAVFQSSGLSSHSGDFLSESIPVFANIFSGLSSFLCSLMKRIS